MTGNLETLVMTEFVVFEGPDGSGKTTLINAVRTRLTDHHLNLVGRKAEPELAAIATILEREDQRPTPISEILLRFAIEFERLSIAEKLRQKSDLVIFDRGAASMIAWMDYLGVAQVGFESVIDELLDHHKDSLTIVTSASFETCWARASSRLLKSRKDGLGEDVNRRYYAQYLDNLSRITPGNPNVLRLDTENDSVEESCDSIIRFLTSRGLCRTPD